MQLLKRGLRHHAVTGVKPLAASQGCVVGEAYTLRFLPLREDLSDPSVLGAPGYGPRVAIEECPPGAILVIEARGVATRSEEHTSELLSLMRISYAVFCLK